MATPIWRLHRPDSTRRRAEWVSKEIELDPWVCPVDPDHRLFKRISTLSVMLPRLPIQDFVWTWYSEILVPDATLEVLRDHGFTGFEIKPASARNKRGSGEPAPRLWELAVTGWGGVAPPESGIRREEWCSGCGRSSYSALADPSRLFDESQWDGSDFFVIWPLPRFVMVTRRVFDAIRKYKLSGASPIPIEHLETGGSGFSPGGLRNWLPEPRAREIGEPLGIY